MPLLVRLLKMEYEDTTDHIFFCLNNFRCCIQKNQLRVWILFQKLIRAKYGRLRDVCVSLEGRVFVATANGSNDKNIILKRK
jgi:hypothetical protein